MIASGKDSSCPMRKTIMDTCRAIREVGERCGLPEHVIAECIADLPAEEI